MRGLDACRAEQEYERLKSRVATLEYDVARLRERLRDLENHEHDEDVFSVTWEDDR